MADTAPEAAQGPSASAASSDATLYLSLRLQALEALILGSLTKGVIGISHTSFPSKSSDPPILRRTLEARTSLDALIEPYKPIRSFVADYERNKPLLVPSSLLSPSSKSASTNPQPAGAPTESVGAWALLPTEKAALILEAQAELRAFERQLSECQTLDRRGLAAAGRLEEHFALAPDLAQRSAKGRKLSIKHDDLEEDVVTQLERYTRLIDTVSELYVEWDQALTGVERRLTVLERAKRERDGLDEVGGT